MLWLITVNHDHGVSVNEWTKTWLQACCSELQHSCFLFVHWNSAVDTFSDWPHLCVSKQIMMTQMCQVEKQSEDGNNNKLFDYTLTSFFFFKYHRWPSVIFRPLSTHWFHYERVQQSRLISRVNSLYRVWRSVTTFPLCSRFRNLQIIIVS